MLTASSSIGVFGQWQPKYAERGIATFPVKIYRGDDGKAIKRPAVKRWQRFGLNGSSQVARKFSDASAFGHVLGPGTGITVLDSDCPDERVLADAMREHGESPVIIRSGSGNYQAWYRHNGETRKTRIGDRPLDILGAGYVVAPPSQGLAGAYQFVQGGLDDLRDLPRLQNLPPQLYVHYEAPQLHADYKSPPSVTFENVPEGKRGDMLFRYCLQAALSCETRDDLLAQAKAVNATYLPPMSDNDVIRAVESAWDKECTGNNWAGRGGRIIITHEDVDLLMREEPDAFLLLSKLKRHHWGRDFVVANAMANTMGWGEKRLARAREILIARGRIIQIRHATFRAPARFQWP
jgi:hypothetical protein